MKWSVRPNECSSAGPYVLRDLGCHNKGTCGKVVDDVFRVQCNGFAHEKRFVYWTY